MDEEHFQIASRRVKIAIPVDTTEMPIRKMDWKRIYRKVHGIPRASSLWEVVSGVLWGSGLSLLLAIIPLLQRSQSPEVWVKPTYWSIGIAFLVIGIFTYYHSRQRRTTIASSCDEVKRDMGEIHNTIFPDESLDDI